MFFKRGKGFGSLNLFLISRTTASGHDHFRNFYDFACTPFSRGPVQKEKSGLSLVHRPCRGCEWS